MDSNDIHIKGPVMGPFFMHALPRRKVLGMAVALLGLPAAPAALASSFEDFFRAIAADNPQTLETLRRRGFDLNTRNEKMEPPLTLSLRLSALQVADYLIGRPEVDVQAANAQDETPLMMAALKGHLAQAFALVERGAQVNKPGWAPLHYAATHAGDHAPALVDLLLEHHAYIDAASPNGSTPLMMATMYGRSSVVGQLLDAGADPTLRNDKGLSAIDFAHRAGRQADAERIAAAIRARQPKGRW